MGTPVFLVFVSMFFPLVVSLVFNRFPMELAVSYMFLENRSAWLILSLVCGVVSN